MTIAIILGAHGSVSKKLLDTTEMIIGKQKNVAWVDLLPEENTKILIEKYNAHLSNLDTSTGVLFMVDTWGGSPFNAAHSIVLNKEKYDIITGMNIPMLIEVFMARDDTHSLQELIQIALNSGNESIKSVKYSLTNHHFHYENNIIKHTPAPELSNKNKKNHMTICLARIDDRLIHGQVVTRWTKEYNVQRIIVVNDEVSKDMIRKTLLTQVTPPGITAHVLDINKTIRVYNNPKYAGDKVIMLFTNPTDVLRLIEGGIPINSVNIGGMAFYKDKKQITNAISVNNTDIEAFKKLDQYGIELEIRKVPSDPSLKMMQLIKKNK
ncbi:PTS mannose transporter subunit IIAB [Blochmannia endosymbiont of Camponotus sp. C-003]|uniref:PTS mannose transporter subunit IIAB n=1 Tax=unclassified Candidatus Blochmanniella TaxID=711328 RepID=UPI00202422F5|nr:MULTISPECIES: PTS mannose transporter subunit IIAB [unclassified Candidatus Blochmannia]URJ23380.1 PTS mannose transporter subunit IIAB [Blochmannia endosymbiont of Camponotus sp. C-003]URJ28853.1 PTS mannose transporter subunit IIAB [Blochmannia endosymbiont of Camponotus sp. C-046]